jgi:hypothetical protein
MPVHLETNAFGLDYMQQLGCLALLPLFSLLSCSVPDEVWKEALRCERRRNVKTLRILQWDSNRSHPARPTMLLIHNETFPRGVSIVVRPTLAPSTTDLVYGMSMVCFMRPDMQERVSRKILTATNLS